MLTVPGHLPGTNALSGNKETRLEQEAIEATHTCYKLQPTSACQQRYTRPKRQSAPAWHTSRVAKEQRDNKAPASHNACFTVLHESLAVGACKN